MKFCSKRKIVLFNRTSSCLPFQLEEPIEIILETRDIEQVVIRLPCESEKSTETIEIVFVVEYWGLLSVMLCLEVQCHSMSK